MDLTITEAATLLDISPRAVRGRLARGALKGYKIGGRWLIPRRHLPLDAAGRRALRRKADSVRAAVEEALPAAAGGRGGGQRFGLGEMDAFRAARAALPLLEGEALTSARAGVLHLAEAHHQYAPADKRRALTRARAQFAHTVAHLLIDDADTDQAIDVIEQQVMPLLAGLLRWVDQLGRSK